MGRRHMPTVDDQLKHLSKKLNLSDDQQAKLKPILEDQRKQMDEIRDDSSLSRQDRFSKMQEVRQGSDTQIKSVLNDDQQKNFDKMREEQANRMKQWHRGGDNAPPAGLLRTVSSNRLRTSDFGPRRNEAVEVRSLRPIFSPKPLRWVILLRRPQELPGSEAPFVHGPLSVPLVQGRRLRGDSRPRLSGGGEAPLFLVERTRPVELRSTGQPRAAVPT